MLRQIAALLLVALSATGQELRVGLQAGPTTLDPQWNLAIANVSALRNVYDPLVGRDAALQPQPGLAESWRPDGDTAWEFRLREGVTFHDGSPFSAEDVRFTLSRLPGLAGNPAPYTPLVAGVREVQVVDPRTVRIVTAAPDPLLPANLASVFILSAAQGARPTALFDSGEAAIGTGPFRVSNWRNGGDLVLERAPRPWATAAPWARATFRPMPDGAARMAALRDGSVDVIDAVPIAEAARLGDQAGLRLFAAPSAFVFMLFPDVGRDPLPGATDAAGAPLARNPFLDPRVRQALSLALDRSALVRDVMQGRATVASQAVPAGFLGHLPDFADVQADPERARALLAEAGLASGFGVPLSCPNDRFPNDARICATAAEMLARVGIRVTVRAMPRVQFFAERARREFALHMAGWGNVTGESGYFLSSQIHTRDAAAGLGLINASGIASSPLDTLIQRARRTLPPEERRGLLQQAMEEVLTANLVIPVLTFEAAWAARAGFRVVPRADEETPAAGITPEP